MDSIEARLHEIDVLSSSDAGELKTALSNLDSFKQQLRDKEKLEIVMKRIVYDEVRVDSSQKHIGINMEMVSFSDMRPNIYTSLILRRRVN